MNQACDMSLSIGYFEIAEPDEVGLTDRICEYETLEALMDDERVIKLTRRGSSPHNEG